MPTPWDDEQFKAAVKELSKVPLKKVIDINKMTTVQKIYFVGCLRELDEALRAYYGQHQASGCECELCHNAARVLATEGAF